MSVADTNLLTLLVNPLHERWAYALALMNKIQKMHGMKSQTR